MRYNGFTYTIGEGFRNIFKNTKSSVGSIITMVCTMILFGLSFAIGINVNSILEQVQMKQGMEVFIWDEVTVEQRDRFENEIKSLDGVNTVTYKNKQQALESMKERMPGNSDLWAGYEGENNIFPASFIVTLTDLEKTKDVITEVERIGAKIATEGRSKEVDLEIDETTIHDSLVKEIRNDDDVVSTLLAIANGIKVAIGVFFAGLLVVSVAIISNTIRLTVHARRKEISIMKYVGATNSFIRGPFIVEGIIIGLIAAIISIVIVGVVYDVVIVKVEASHILQQMSVTLTKFMEIAKPVSLIYCVLGMGVGIVGSMLSMNKYLEV
ncbi:MAG: permease-like cell division protein FtsX [Clostridia bacterium]|nr:permease-like cell division protein FtsX [Clostridia bacterium]